MLTRRFGDSSVNVSALGFGAGHIGGSLPEDDARAVVEAALDAGVTFFDTARGYGASEERLGRFLSSRRDDVVISTKVGYDVPGHGDWTSGAVVGGVEAALRRLRTEVLDVVFLHSCDLSVLQRGEVVEALLACRDAGTVRMAGYSGENAALAWAVDSDAFDVVQTSVNLADQHSLRRVLPEAARRGLGVVAKRPIANAVWRHGGRPEGVYGEEYWLRLREMAVEPEDGDWLGTALRFTVFSPGVSTAIVGTARPESLHTAAEAVARGPLPEPDRRRWEDAFAPYAAAWPGLT